MQHNFDLLCLTLYYRIHRKLLPITESSLKCDWVKGKSIVLQNAGRICFLLASEQKVWASSLEVNSSSGLFTESEAVCSVGMRRNESSHWLLKTLILDRGAVVIQIKTASCGLKCGTSTVSTDRHLTLCQAVCCFKACIITGETDSWGGGRLLCGSGSSMLGDTWSKVEGEVSGSGHLFSRADSCWRVAAWTQYCKAVFSN